MADMRNQIQNHMPIVGSEGGNVGVVDHLDGDNAIKVTKDAQGNHHWIPLDWVSKVDDKVHLDRPGTQVEKDWATSAPQA